MEDSIVRNDHLRENLFVSPSWIRVVLIAYVKSGFSEHHGRWKNERTYRRIVLHYRDGETAKFLSLPRRLDCLVAMMIFQLCQGITGRTGFIQGADRIIVNPLIRVSMKLAVNRCLCRMLHRRKTLSIVDHAANRPSEESRDFVSFSAKRWRRTLMVPDREDSPVLTLMKRSSVEPSTSAFSLSFNRCNSIDAKQRRGCSSGTVRPTAK